MFLTRMGRNARFIVTGDVTQYQAGRGASDSGSGAHVVEMLREDGGHRDRRIRQRATSCATGSVKHIVEAFDKCGTDLSKVEK